MINDWVYDLELYPNVFTFAFEHVDAPFRGIFEISEFRDDSIQLLAFLNFLEEKFQRLVGYNNVGFDYPILHQFIRSNGRCGYASLYEKCQAIIGAQDKQDRWAHLVKPTDRVIPQLDLFLVHHFDNAAKATSLKALEFNMRSHTIEDLPFPVGTSLTREQIEVLKRYNAHDVSETRKFYHHSKHMIAFREELSKKYHRDFTNHNDTKIGKDFFVMELEKANVSCYDYTPSRGRTPRQTPRPVIHLRDAILPWIQFQHPEFQRVLNWLKEQNITGTKDVLKETYYVTKYDKDTGEPYQEERKKDVKATIDGFDFIFGTGGIHGSLKSEIVTSDKEYMILDLDVTSYYPNLAIKNRFYPEHLGEKFVSIYDRLFEQRKQYPKKSAESAMLKLALNGVYGDSGNQHSVFYDPLFTMKITLNGQLLLCLLAENLVRVPGLRMLQINTDGLTVRLPRNQESLLYQVCEWWSKTTQLTLEDIEYNRINIRDVNNYLAVSTKGTVKRKGAYEWQAGGWYDNGYNGWNQDASCLVVRKVAEKVLTEDVSIRQTVEKWPDVMDFMIRVKVPRTQNGQPCYLYWGDEQVQNTTRYLVTTNGRPLTKMLPPLPKKPDEWRRSQIEAGWNVTVANNLSGWGVDTCHARMYAIDYDYYIEEVEKLVNILR